MLAAALFRIINPPRNFDEKCSGELENSYSDRVVDPGEDHPNPNHEIKTDPGTDSIVKLNFILHHKTGSGSCSDKDTRIRIHNPGLQV